MRISKFKGTIAGIDGISLLIQNDACDYAHHTVYCVIPEHENRIKVGATVEVFYDTICGGFVIEIED